MLVYDSLTYKEDNKLYWKEAVAYTQHLRFGQKEPKI